MGTALHYRRYRLGFARTRTWSRWRRKITPEERRSIWWFAIVIIPMFFFVLLFF
jgi:hypothetical protein